MAIDSTSFVPGSRRESEAADALATHTAPSSPTATALGLVPSATEFTIDALAGSMRQRRCALVADEPHGVAADRNRGGRRHEHRRHARALELQPGAQGELPHPPVGASEPDGGPVDGDRRRGSDALHERLGVICVRVDPGDLSGYHERPDGALADRELDGCVRHGDHPISPLEDDPLPHVAELWPDVEHAENASFVEGDPDRSLSGGQPRRDPLDGDALPRQDDVVRLRIDPRQRAPFVIDQPDAPAPAAIRGELNPTGMSATTRRVTGSTTPTDPGPICVAPDVRSDRR